MPQNKNIYITGFMGCGKTTVGRLLAKKLNRKFVDTDSRIEEKAKTTINQVFEDHGEAHFRELESQEIKECDQQNSLVVSLGGGAILDPRNQLILKKGIWIFLQTPFPIIEERVMRKSHRPLATESQKLEELYKKRMPVYQKAEHIIDCDGDSEKVCQEIIKQIIHK